MHPSSRRGGGHHKQKIAYDALNENALLLTNPHLLSKKLGGSSGHMVATNIMAPLLLPLILPHILPLLLPLPSRLFLPIPCEGIASGSL